MAAVRASISPGVVRLEAATPGFAPGFVRREKIREIDRRHLCPDPAGAAEIGDPRLGADASSGEYDRLPCAFDDAGKLGNLMIDRHSREFGKSVATRQVPRAILAW